MNQNEYERLLDNDEFLTDAINEFNQESIEDEIEESIPEPVYQSEEPIKYNMDEPFDVLVDVVNDEPIYQSDNKEIDDINKIMEDAMSLINVPPLIEEVQVTNNWIEPTPEIPSQDEEEELKKKSSGELEEESETTFLSTPSPTTSEEFDELYLESDETNPLQIIYDLDNDRVIVPTSDDDSIIEEQTLNPARKTFRRNVGNSRRRNSR
jgi:hypothetical protein